MIWKRTYQYFKATELKCWKVFDFLYGREMWTIQRIQVDKMSFLRVVTGYKLTDQKKNEDVRAELNVVYIMCVVK